MPNLIAYDIVGSFNDWSTGLIFAMRSRYTSQTGNEALFDEADTDFSSRNAAGDSSQGVDSGATTTDHGGTNTSVLNDGGGTSDYSRGQGMTTVVQKHLVTFQAISLLRWTFLN